MRCTILFLALLAFSDHVGLSMQTDASMIISNDDHILNRDCTRSNQSFEEWIANQINQTQSINQSTIYRIPVIVHVVHNGENIGEGANISYDQIVSQIDVLNEDFRRMQGTNGFNDNPVGADIGIEFFLTEKDTSGHLLPEPGVNRINGGRAIWPTGISQSVENILKPNTIWDPDRYFNIWTINFGGFIGRNLLGYAQFPVQSGLQGLENTEEAANTDGIVVGYQYFGSSEKGDFPSLRAPYNLGRTTTHEVGHWLGLRHIWGDGNCTVDDYVIDTPTAAEPTYSCPDEFIISCTEPIMYENYMDYSEDRCMNIFTLGQKERMIAVLENSPRRPAEKSSILYTDNDTDEHPRIFPIPALDFITIDFSDKNHLKNIRIIDASGKLMNDRKISVTTHRSLISTRIAVDDLPSGIYYMQLITQDGRISVARFIVNH